MENPRPLLGRPEYILVFAMLRVHLWKFKGNGWLILQGQYTSMDKISYQNFLAVSTYLYAKINRFFIQTDQDTDLFDKFKENWSFKSEKKWNLLVKTGAYEIGFP